MGDDTDNEEPDVEEEEEVEAFTPIDVSEMADGDRSVVLGGWSTIASVEEGIAEALQVASKMLLVCEGAYSHITLHEDAVGINIVSSGDPTHTTFAGITATVSVACITGATFTAGQQGKESASAAQISCEAATSCKISFTDCHFSGGKHAVEVHAFGRPTFTGCTIRCGQAAGLYCYPRSHPTLRSGVRMLSSAQLMSGKAPSDKPAVSLSEGDMVSVLSFEPPEEDGTKWAQVSFRSAVPVLPASLAATAAAAQNSSQVVNRYYEGFVKKAVLDYTNPTCTTVEGTGDPADRTVGVFADDASCELHNAKVSGVQTGCYMRDTCKGSLLVDTDISAVSGTGLYLDGGCRTVARGVHVSGCAHYALLVAKGTSPGSDETSLLCQVLEEANATGDEVGVQQIKSCLGERGVQINEQDRTWTDTVSRSTGSWGPSETRSVLRNCVFSSNVRLDEGTSASFFGNVVVQPAQLHSRHPFVVNGIRTCADAPKRPVLQREEEAEE